MEKDDKNDMTISKLAKQSGVGIETVRFYQRKGLLEEPSPASGFRKYSHTHARIIKFVKHEQRLGFSLISIKELLEVSACSSQTQPHLQEICQKKMREVEEKIVGLEQMKEMLTDFSLRCGNKNREDSACDLLACFEKDWKCCQKIERNQ